MAGRKATNVEREKIAEMTRKGMTVAEIMKEFPEINGQVISGIHRYTSQNRERVETAVQNHTENQAEAQARRDHDEKVRAESRGAAAQPERTKTPEEISQESTGFTPSGPTGNFSTGFKPAYKEYFVIKKMDPPDAGILKHEYPPFDITTLVRNYKPGDYEIIHYRDGRIFQTYREQISAAAKQSSEPNSQVQRDHAATRVESPTDTFIKSVEIYDRISGRTRQQEDAARAAAAAVELEKVKGNQNLENAALVSMTSLVTKALEPKPDPNGGNMAQIITVLKEEQNSASARAKAELEAMRERSKLEREEQAERLKADLAKQKAESEAQLERMKLDLQTREKMQQDFMAKMAEIDQKRQDLHKEILEQNVQRLTDQQEAFSRELQEKREWQDKQFELQKKHLDELAKLREQSAQKSDSLEIGKLIVSGLDRVGARVDMLADKGVIPIANPSGGTQQRLPAPKQPVEDKIVLNSEKIKAAVKEPWFQDLQEEIFLTVKKRINAKDVQLKPHGSMLGQAFIQQMNEGDNRLRPYFHFLCSREWPDIMKMTEEGIKADYKSILYHEEATAWFTEFQAFLTSAWNQTIGVQ